jgi:diaminopropionate ammonia-lyase
MRILPHHRNLEPRGSALSHAPTATWRANMQARAGSPDRKIEEHFNIAALDAVDRLIRRCPIYAMTPLKSLRLTGAGGAKLFYKDEGSRFGLGSFKALGGAYAVLHEVARMVGPTLEQGFEAFGSSAWRARARDLTFVCATDGNHGLAVAAGARVAGAKAVIFVHSEVDPRRREAIASAGAEVRVAAGHYDESIRAAASAARLEGWRLIADTSDEHTIGAAPLVMQGYTAMIAEAVRQAAHGGAVPRDVCPFTHVFLQAGVGGLAAAASAWFAQIYGSERPRLVVVEPASCDCLFQSHLHDRISPASGDLSGSLVMLACRTPSALAWRILRSTADAFMTVDELQARGAVRLARTEEIATTTSGACGLAGALSADPDLVQYLGLNGKSRVLVIGSEGPNDDSGDQE